MSRGEKSIIDYVLVENKNRKTVMDTKTQRGPEIGSDHYAVVTKIRETNNTENCEIRKQMKLFENIKSYKLRRKDIAKKYEEVLDEKIQRTSGIVNCTNIEKLWSSK